MHPGTEFYFGICTSRPDKSPRPMSSQRKQDASCRMYSPLPSSWKGDPACAEKVDTSAAAAWGKDLEGRGEDEGVVNGLVCSLR